MCILVHFCLKNKNKEKNDKQPSQSLINDSPLRLFPLLKADKSNAICKQNYMRKRAPKVKCFLHSNCLYTHIDATSPIFGDIITEHLQNLVRRIRSHTHQSCHIRMFHFVVGEYKTHGARCKFSEAQTTKTRYRIRVRQK